MPMNVNTDDVAHHPKGTTFRESDELLDGGDRRLTLWAVLAAFVGLASSVALMSPLLWVVPAAAVFFGAIAIRTVRNSEGTLSGDKLAAAGIGLAVVFLSWSATSHWIRTRVLFAQAQVLADEWFDLVQQRRLQEAHQLRRNFTDRAPPNMPLDKIYSEQQPREMLAGFAREPVVEKIVLLGEDAKVTFVGNLYVRNVGHLVDAVVMRYKVESKSGKEKPAFVEVELSRESFDGVRESRWALKRIDLQPIE